MPPQGTTFHITEFIQNKSREFRLTPKIFRGGQRLKIQKQNQNGATFKQLLCLAR